MGGAFFAIHTSCYIVNGAWATEWTPGAARLAHDVRFRPCVARTRVPEPKLKEFTSRSNDMQVTDILDQTGGLQSIARELGISESQAASGAAALAPAVLGGFKKQAQAQPGGLEGLGGLLNQLGGGGLLDDVLASRPTDVGRGNEVLGQIFGSKDVSRAVAQNAASQSGLDP